MANVKICTLAEFKVYAGLSDTTYDTLLQVYINSVTDIFNAYCWKVFGEVKTVTQITDIEDKFGDRILLKYSPLITVTAVLDNYDPLSQSGINLTQNKDYYVYKGAGLIKTAFPQHFHQGLQKVRIDYVAGYSTVPDDVKMAAYMQIQYLWRNARGGEGKSSERIGNYSFTRSTKDNVLLPEVQAILDRHRKIGL